MRRLFLISFIFLNLIIGLGVSAQSAFSPYTLKSNEVLMNQSSYNVDLIDPTAATGRRNSYFPGFRGANQMIVYTSAFGYRTNTNEYGTEAIVVDNIVTEISGADSVIPKNGLVISGHGKAKNWMNKNLTVGTKVYINKNTKLLTAYTTSDSYIYSAQSQIKEVKYIVGKYLQSHTGYNSRRTNAYITQAENYIGKAMRSRVNVKKYSELAIEAANTALASAIPYKDDELRGVWIRPTFKTQEEICLALDSLSQAGINTIFIETYYHGMTIYPSTVMASRGFVKVNPDYANFDALDFWIHEAHKRNIKVHIWFETFYIGNKNPANNPKNIISINPSWANVTKRDYNQNRPTASVSEHNGYFLDPANPEVQNFLLELLCEIIQKYRPDGINLDYIRYPQSISSQYVGSDMSSWGYTLFARNDYKNIYGVDPVELTQFEPLWESWNEYRRDKVTEFVRRASKICRSNNVAITAVIFPNRQAALDMKQQDWKRWSVNNYVDGFTPLFLTCDPATATGLMKEVLNNKDSKTKLYAGLFITFMNGSESDLIKQINAMRDLSLDGFSIFDYAHFGEKYIKPLTISICTEPKPENRLNPFAGQSVTNRHITADNTSNSNQTKRSWFKRKNKENHKYERRKYR